MATTDSKITGNKRKRSAGILNDDPSDSPLTKRHKQNEKRETKCLKCKEFYGHSDGYCSICYEEVNGVGTFLTAMDGSEYAPFFKGTVLESVQYAIIPFLLSYPRSYYHHMIEDDENEYKERQLVYDDWYMASKRGGKLRRSINIIKKMISKQNKNEFIKLLCKLQPWMTAKDICDILYCLPPRDNQSSDPENAQKIIALTYFGMNFFKQKGEYTKKIIEFLKNNGGYTLICFRIVSYGDSTECPWYKLIGRHVIKWHIGDKRITEYISARKCIKEELIIDWENVDKPKAPMILTAELLELIKLVL